MSKNAEALRALFESPSLTIIPCCWDALSAKLIEQAGFPLAFMSGFGVSASRLGLPGTGQISASEMIDQARNIYNAVSVPTIGDGDTGYGSAVNVKRTVWGHANASMQNAFSAVKSSPCRR